jgi:hypothetical protein
MKCYPKLEIVDWNRVLCCRACNGLKRDWNPNAPDGEDPLFEPSSEPPSREILDVLILRAREHVKKKREIVESRFKQQREVMLRALREAGS